MERRDRRIAFALACLTALATLVPYLVAERMAPEGSTFAGFLLNPIDGFSYLAKMRQGMDGDWLFRLPYASDAGAGAFLYPYYLLLGHLARGLHLDLITVLHAARVLAGAFMYLSIDRALRAFVPGRWERWYAYGLCLIGAWIWAGWLLWRWSSSSRCCCGPIAASG
jgi:hypothetical protein